MSHPQFATVLAACVASALLLCAPAEGSAQALPAACRRLPLKISVYVAPPSSEDWLGDLADSAGNAVGGVVTDLPDGGVLRVGSDSIPNVRRLDAMWARDSTGMEWALAYLVTDSFGRSVSTAFAAASAYRRYSGRAGPMLSLLDDAGSQDRASIALSAIRAPLTASQELAVFKYACSAVWLLNSLASDASVAAWFRQSGELSQEQSQAFDTIRLARELLTGQRREEVDTWSRRLARTR